MMQAKPKGPVPSLIGGTNGRPQRAVVQRKCNCKRCGKELCAGEECIEIPQLGQAFSNKKRVCNECFTKILEKTEKDLETLRVI
jgi:hypothetical protein